MGRLQPSHVALSGALGALVALSVMDLVLTLSLLRVGAQEVNPLLAWLYSVDPRAFVAAKLGLTAMACGLLWHLRREKAASVVAFGALILYAGVMVAHWFTLAAYYR